MTVTEPAVTEAAATEQVLPGGQDVGTAIAEGRSIFDFGRSSPGSGPHKYKLQWGAGDLPLRVSTWSVTGSHDPFATESAKWRIGSRVWRRLPAFVTARAGPWLRGQLPS